MLLGFGRVSYFNSSTQARLHCRLRFTTVGASEGPLDLQHHLAAVHKAVKDTA